MLHGLRAGITCTAMLCMVLWIGLIIAAFKSIKTNRMQQPNQNSHTILVWQKH